MTVNIKPRPKSKVELHPNLAAPRDGRGSPLLYPWEGGKPAPFTRVTAFITSLEDMASVQNWKLRNALVGGTMIPNLRDLVDLIEREETDEETGQPGINRQLAEYTSGAGKRLDALIEKAERNAGGKYKADRGTHLHELSEHVDQGIPLPDLPEEDIERMDAYFEGTLELTHDLVEQFLIVPELRVAGTTDRVVLYDGPGPDGKPISGRFISDLKTGKIEHTTKIGAQLAIYSRGRTYDFSKFPAPFRNKEDRESEKGWEAWRKIERTAEEAQSCYGERLDVNQDWGIAIHLPSTPAWGQEPGPCTLHWANLSVGWEMALLAQHIREVRKLKLLTPFGACV